MFIVMGGVKKKSLSSSKTENQQPGDNTKSKKDESKAQSKIQKKKSSVVIDDVNDINVLKGMKSITAQSVSKILGVKISVANNYLKNLESKGQIQFVGGYSGHKVYSIIRN